MTPKFDPALNEITSGISGRTAYDPFLGSLVSGGALGDFFYDPVSGLVRKSFGPTGPIVRVGKLFDVGLATDANLVAYWPLVDGNLTDTVSGRVLQNHGCSYIPGKGMFPGTLADYANPDYRNTQNYLFCPDDLGMSYENSDFIIMAQVQLFQPSPSAVDEPLLVSCRFAPHGIANGLRANGNTVYAFRLKENVAWHLGKGRTVGFSTAESGTWTHFMSRRVWQQWLETMINVTNPGGGDYGGNGYGSNSTGTFETGLSVFGEWHGTENMLIRQTTAIVKEIAVFNSYNPAEGDSGWTKFLSAYGNPT